jgi:hypothetical protein
MACASTASRRIAGLAISIDRAHVAGLLAALSRRPPTTGNSLGNPIETL